jgi:hypothetical protein
VVGTVGDRIYLQWPEPQAHSASREDVWNNNVNYIQMWLLNGISSGLYYCVLN